MSYCSYFECKTDICLPIMHTTQEYFFRKIIREKEIELNKCDVLKEELIFFFYGRPAYRIQKKDDNYYLHSSPCVLIVKPITLKNIRNIFPFDSGAYSLYQKHNLIRRDINLKEYHLGNDLKIIDDHIDKYWKSIKDYVLQNRKEIRDEIFQKDDGTDHYIKIEMYYNMLKELITVNEIDDRRSTIEISINEK